MRRAAKKDRNHPEIVKALRSAGCKVLDLGAVGNGCPDLLVSRGDRIRFIEVKDGKKAPSARVLTGYQVAFRQEWGEMYWVATSTEEALRIMGVNA